MFALKRSLGVVGLLLSLLVAPVWAADGDDIQSVKLKGGPTLSLNGLGAMHEFSGDIFIGGFYLEHRYKNPEDIANPQSAKRMAIRVVADRFSARRFGQMLRDRIAINSSADDLKPFPKELQQISSAFSGTLQKGDHINIDAIPGTGIRISLNGVDLALIQKTEFIAPVAYAWVGERPPSASFKQGVLGLGDSAMAIDLQTRFAALKPDSKRVAEVREARKGAEAQVAAN